MTRTCQCKDSGVEWLGEIPAHWGVISLRRLAKRIQTGTTPLTSEARYYEDGSVPWHGPSSFGEDLSLREAVKLISYTAVRDGTARVFEPGSVAIVTIGATIGKVAYMERSGSFNQQITCVVFDQDRILGKYGAYQLKRLEPVLRGTAPGSTLPIIDQGGVGDLGLVVPPISEQSAISAWLNGETAKNDALMAKIRDGIVRLKELRTALISAAVTGKIDVREGGA